MPSESSTGGMVQNLLGSFRKFFDEPAPQGTRVFGMRGHSKKKGPCLACFFVGPKSKKICTVSPTHIEIYDARTAKLLKSVEAPGSSHFTCAVSGTMIRTNQNGSKRRGYPVVFLGRRGGVVQLFYPETGEFGLELDASGAAEEEEVVVGSEETAQQDSGYDHGNDLTSLAVAVDEYGGATRIFGGATGKVFSWDAHSGRLLDVLLAPRQDAVVSSIAPVGDRTLWIGLNSGDVLVVDWIDGELIGQPVTETNSSVSAFTVAKDHGVMFVLSAHKKVFVFDLKTYEALNGFPAGLMTCGEDVSSMQVVTVPTDNSKPTSILVLGATNGAYCMRRVGRRKDGRVHCVLLSCCSGAEIEVGAPKFGFPPMMESCPITVLSYNSGTDTFLFGDAMGVASEVTGLSRELTDRQLLPASVQSPLAAPVNNLAGGLIPYAPPSPLNAQPTEIPVIPSSVAAAGYTSPCVTLPGSDICPSDTSMPELEMEMVVHQSPRSVSPKKLVLSPERKLHLEQQTSAKTQVPLDEESTTDDFYHINVVSPPNSPPRGLKARMARDREMVRQRAIEIAATQLAEEDTDSDFDKESRSEFEDDASGGGVDREETPTYEC